MLRPCEDQSIRPLSRSSRLRGLGLAEAVEVHPLPPTAAQSQRAVLAPRSSALQGAIDELLGLLEDAVEMPLTFEALSV